MGDNCDVKVTEEELLKYIHKSRISLIGCRYENEQKLDKFLEGNFSIIPSVSNVDNLLNDLRLIIRDNRIDEVLNKDDIYKHFVIDWGVVKLPSYTSTTSMINREVSIIEQLLRISHESDIQIIIRTQVYNSLSSGKVVFSGGKTTTYASEFTCIYSNSNDIVVTKNKFR